MSVGLGFGPLGTIGAGAPYADAQTGPISATTIGARLIGTNGDYALDSDGQWAQATDTMQRVLWAVRTAIGGSTEAADHGIHTPETVSDSIAIEMRSAVVAALRRHADVNVLDVQVEVVSGVPITRVTYLGPEGEEQVQL